MSMFVLAMSCTAGGQIIYVDANAPACGDGISWPTAYKYLQDALGEAQAGNEIWVAEGAYEPDASCAYPDGSGSRKASFKLKSGVAIYGGFPSGGGDWEDRDPNSYETILSGDLLGNDLEVGDPCDLLNDPCRAENSYSVVLSERCNSMGILDGFTITGGNANGPGWYRGDQAGGGMYNYHGGPSISTCIFKGNSSVTDGGGMYNLWSRPTLTNCTFSGNFAPQGGGAIYNHEVQALMLTNCTFRGNSANHGGGMGNYITRPTITNCTFIANSASQQGGGIYNSDSSSGGLTNCKFSGNSARDGGGIYNYHTRPELVNCEFHVNSARSSGGGMCNNGSSPKLDNCTFNGNSTRHDGGGMSNWDNSTPELTDCTFSGNSTSYNGGGMYNSESEPNLTNCTFCGNSAGQYGGGISNYNNSNLRFTNCIIWGNIDNSGSVEPAQIHNHSSTPVVTFSCIQDDDPNDGYILYGDDNIDDDPMFVNDCNDIHLLVASPCIDRGAFGCYAGETDIDGEPRVMGFRVDMGADEVVDGCPTCKGDLDGNNFIMLSDLFAMIAALGQAGPPYQICIGEMLWNPCADLDDNEYIMMSDMFALIAQLGQAGPPYIIPCP